ncbi:MAG: DUF4097 family beta strand repeat-containing protein [Balneolaceae bacterium]|nr:DUF4097 family beta strand repeat-containing protein [Balneolaceae bacterium]
MPKLSYVLFVLSILLLCTVTAEAQKNDEFTLDETYALSQGGTISLDSDDANVTITGSDRQDVRVKVNYRMRVKGLSFGKWEEFEMIVEKNEGYLNIYEKERDNGVKIMMGSSREEYEITIEAPRTANLELNGDDDNYRISSIDGAISVEADDADVELNDCNGERFTIRLDDGDFSSDGGSGSLDVEMEDGDVRVLNGNFSDIQIVSDDGDVDITTALTDGGNYRFEIDDGDLILNVAGGGGEFVIRHDDADISVSRDFEETMTDDDISIYTLPLGSAKVSIQSDDGDVVLRVI